MLIGCVTFGCDKVESLVDDAKKDMGVGAPAQNVETPATPAQPAPVAATPQPAGPSADVVLANLKSKAPNVIDDQTLVAVANVPGGSNAAVSEYAVTTAATLTRRFAWSDREIKAGNYAAFRARMVADNLAEIGRAHV